MKNSFYILLCLLLSHALIGQEMLIVCPDAPIDLADCGLQISQGDIVDIVLDCDQCDDNLQFVITSTSFPPQVIYQEMLGNIAFPLSIPFPNGGSYVVSCNGAFGGAPLDIVCVAVAVPTLGVWAIIILGLIFIALGIGVVYSKVLKFKT